MESIQDRINEAKRDCDKLKETIQNIRKEKNDANLREASKDVPPLLKSRKLRVRRTLKGHLLKIYALHWAEDKVHLVSAAQDGKLLVWDTVSTNKTHVIPLRTTWVMCCAYSPSGNFVACGGLDNICSVYNLRSKDVPIRPCRELGSHTGYLSSARFISDNQIISSSGDTTCILWDLVSGAQTVQFSEHDGDVMSISLNPVDPNTFISGAIDSTAKYWDIRTGKCVQTFTGHKQDINTVQFFPNGMAFGTGSDDTTTRLYDIRADRELMVYSNEENSNTNNQSAVTSIAFSISGRYLFAGYDDFNCHAWDVLKGEKIFTLQGHENRVSCLGVSSDGMALCTGSWDSVLKIWA